MNALARRKLQVLLATGLLALLVGLGALFWPAGRRHATVSALANTVLALADQADFDRGVLDSGFDEMRAHAHFFAGLLASGDASSDDGQESVRLVFTADMPHRGDIARLSYFSVTPLTQELVRVERNAADRLARVDHPATRGDRPDGGPARDSAGDE